jgi:hypothetical protein
MIGVILNGLPNSPEKLCPDTIMGMPTPTSIVALVTVLAPPGPVALSAIVVDPFVEGYPVISPVVELIVAQLGNPIASQLVAGLFAGSVSENVLENASPIAPKEFCPGVITGSPTAILITIVPSEYSP